MPNQPWWGTPLVAGIFAFTGVIVAQVVIVILDFLKIRREDARRWHTDRRKIYAECLAAAVKIATYVVGYRTGNAIDEAKLWEMHEDLIYKSEEINIVASESVREAMNRLGHILQEQLSYIMNKGKEPSEERLSQMRRRLLEFSAAARRELGVKD
jgi:hypothetical protein